jgi:hypothetical protein
MPVSIIYDERGRIVAALRLSDGAQGMATSGDGQNVLMVDNDDDLETMLNHYRVDVSQGALVRQPAETSSSQD